MKRATGIGVIAALLLLGMASLSVWIAPAPARADGIASITSGSIHLCALTNTGGIKCWGDGRIGQLGNHAFHGCAAMHIPCSTLPVDVVGLDHGVVELVAGGDHSCALLPGNHVQCWGASAAGQLGTVTTEICIINAPCSTTPVEVEGLTGTVAHLAAGDSHTCAILDDASITCWGANGFGQLGDGTQAGRATPAAVPGLGGVIALSLGNTHSCALVEGGAVKCWGDNRLGELGADTQEFCGPQSDLPCSTTPLDVAGLNTPAVAIEAGDGFTCVLTEAGGVKCWGRGERGQLGDGTTVTRPSPADVTGLTTGVAAIGIGAKGQHACALLTSGGLDCWGDNQLGQLGAPSSDGCGVGAGLPCSTTPLAVTGLASGVVSLAIGGDQNCVLMQAGGLKCWGRDDRGQLGSISMEQCGFLRCSTTPLDMPLGLIKPTPTPCPDGICPTPTSTPQTAATPTPTATPNPTATPRGALGDVDCNRHVDSIDATLLLQADASLINPASVACYSLGDVNGDGATNVIDVTLILQLVAGLINHLPGDAISISLSDNVVSLGSASAQSGAIRFDVMNQGGVIHNLLVIKTELAPGALPVSNDAVDETHVDIVARTEALAPGRSAQLDADLPAGRYVLICNVPGHYALGMYTAFVVTSR